MLGAVGMRGQADHQLTWLPFFHQLGDGFKLGIVAVAADRCQRMAHAQFSIALRHAYARFAKVKRQRRAFGCFMHALLL